MKIELRPVASIRSYPKNPRKNEAAVGPVAESIRQFGFRVPIVVDADGIIVCGHTRYQAALKLGLTEVPVHVAADLTPEQCKAYRLADNKTGSLAEFDFDLLPAEILDLSTGDIDLTDFGWMVEDIKQMVRGEQLLSDLEGWRRPTAEDLVGTTLSKSSSCSKNANWFFCALYDDAAAYREIKELLAIHLTGEHEIDPQWLLNAARYVAKPNR